MIPDILKGFYRIFATERAIGRLISEVANSAPIMDLQVINRWFYPVNATLDTLYDLGQSYYIIALCKNNLLNDHYAIMLLESSSSKLEQVKTRYIESFHYEYEYVTGGNFYILNMIFDVFQDMPEDMLRHVTECVISELRECREKFDSNLDLEDI